MSKRAMKVGWYSSTIGEVCGIVNGGTPKSNRTEYWGGNNLWITPAEMGKLKSPYVDNTERKITDLGLKNSSARILPSNSIILSSRAPIGYLIINTKPMSTNQGCKGLIPKAFLHYKYLYYYLSSIVDQLEALGTGATFKELSGSRLREVEILVPPFQEQKDIATILDESFANIGVVQASAEKNLGNARAMFDSYLKEVFRRRGTGWEETTLDKISFNLDNKRKPITKNVRQGGIYPYYGASGIVDYVADYIFDSETLLVSEDGANLLTRSTPIAFPATGKYWVNNHAHICIRSQLPSLA